MDTEPEALRQRRGGISRVVPCYVMSQWRGQHKCVSRTPTTQSEPKDEDR